MTGLPWRPIITYGPGPTTLQLSMPQKLWDYKTLLIGGARKSSSGVPESFVIREENTTNLNLRVHDCEYLAVRAWIKYIQETSSQFTFQFDADDPLSVFTCYLEAPAMDDGYAPKRMQNWPNAWDFPVTIRAVDRVPMFYSFAQQCDINTTATFAMDWIISQDDASALPYGAGRNILSISPVAPEFPPPGIIDPSALDGSDFTPAGWDAAGVLFRSINPIMEWITRPLSAGYVIPDYGVIGGGTTGSPASDWYLQDALLSLHHLRAGVIIASSAGDIASFGWLGGGSYTDFDVSDIGALQFEDNDQLLLRAYSRYMPKAGGDHSGRLGLSFGSVFGPLTTTRLYGRGNVTELP